MFYNNALSFEGFLEIGIPDLLFFNGLFTKTFVEMIVVFVLFTAFVLMVVFCLLFTWIAVGV